MFLVRPPKVLRWFMPDVVWRMRSTGKNLFLTFDDGPIPEVTPWVLDLLKKENVKATFFCVGENVKKYPDVFKRIVKEGHQVGNHSFNHVQAFKIKKDDYLSNVVKAEECIDSKLFRPPHGQINYRLKQVLRKRFKIIMWDVLSGDYDKDRSGEKCSKDVIKKARPGSILVFHDSLKADRNLRIALPQVIVKMKNQGYSFQIIPDHF